MSQMWLLAKLSHQSYGAVLMGQPVLRSKMNAVVVDQGFDLSNRL